MSIVSTMVVGVLFGVMSAMFIPEIIRDAKDIKYDKEQRLSLSLLFPLLTDKGMWRMSEDGEYMVTQLGNFYASIRPHGFTNHYHFKMWMRMRTGGKQELLELRFNDKGWTNRTSLSYLVNKKMLQEISDLPLYEMTTGFRREQKEAQEKSQTKVYVSE